MAEFIESDNIVITQHAVSNVSGNVSVEGTEVTENPLSLLPDPEVTLVTGGSGDVEFDTTVPFESAKEQSTPRKSEQNSVFVQSLSTDAAANITTSDLINFNELTLACPENVDNMPSAAEGFTEGAKSVQEVTLNVTDNLKTLPLREVDHVAIEENSVNVTVIQTHIENKPAGSMSSGGIFQGTASAEMTSSEVSGARLTQWNKERLTSNVNNSNENAASTAMMQSLSNTNSQPQSRYELKKIQWYNHVVPIVTQNENGPCPLIAIANTLLLRGKITIPLIVKEVTAEQLMEYVANCIMENIPKNLSGITQLNYEQNMHDAIGVLPRLLTGLDVNIRFTGVRDFEYTPECIIFDLLNIPLYHGWLVDPQAKEVVGAVGNLGYNQLVEKIILNKFSDDNDLVTKALTAEMFLENSATQLTYHGLCELNSTMVSNELAVLFRNNHFSTIFKRKNEIFQLVTDQGFLNEPRVIWEVLCNIEGDSMFVDAKFADSPKVAEVERVPVTFTPLPESVSKEQQIQHDFLVALSLQEDQAINRVSEEPREGFGDVGSNTEVSSLDLELARCMQQSYQQGTDTVPSRSPSTKHLRSPDRKKKESGCTIL